MMLAKFSRDPALVMLNRQFDELFQGFFGPQGMRRPFPALNVWIEDAALHVEAELPGMTLQEVEVLVEGDQLTIRGERKITHEGNVHRAERLVGRFSRTLTLPVEVDAEQVKATLKDGVLSIVLPKHERARRRRIEVKGD